MSTSHLYGFHMPHILHLLRNEVVQYITDDTINANIFVTFENNQPGVVGIAYVNATCSSDRTIRASINEYYLTPASTGQVR